VQKFAEYTLHDAEANVPGKSDRKSVKSEKTGFNMI
jgi:hypothetical protein